MSGIMNKVLGALKLYEFDEYDDYEDLDYDEEEEAREERSSEKKSQPKERKGLFNRKEKDIKPEEEENYTSRKEKTTYHTKNVVPIKGGVDISNMEVCLVYPKTEDDKREIADTLLDGKSVVINMEGLEVDKAQSFVDFTSGTCYAIGGDLKQIAKYIFIATPKTVELVGEFMDMDNSKSEHTIDISGFKNNF